MNGEEDGFVVVGEAMVEVGGRGIRGGKLAPSRARHGKPQLGYLQYCA